ncbi:MAG: hypothetical protein MZU95_09050 [Desulfomicrobium escambiense]|nr:hypothetical protein [Desulfomicrobium escambiense]
MTATERDNPVVAAGTFEFVLTEKEALISFERAKKLFSAWNDEAALVEINENPAFQRRPIHQEQGGDLEGFLREPDFTNVRERYSYSDVARSPRLFDGVAVLWKGQASNVREGEGGPSFDFLVGYHEKKNLDGIVAVTFRGSVRVTPGTPLEYWGGCDRRRRASA